MKKYIFFLVGLCCALLPAMADQPELLELKASDANIIGHVLDKKTGEHLSYGEFYQFNLSSCIRQQNSLTAQFVSFSLANLANIFYPPRFLQ